MASALQRVSSGTRQRAGAFLAGAAKEFQTIWFRWLVRFQVTAKKYRFRGTADTMTAWTGMLRRGASAIWKWRGAGAWVNSQCLALFLRAAALTVNARRSISTSNLGGEETSGKNLKAFQFAQSY